MSRSSRSRKLLLGAWCLGLTFLSGSARAQLYTADPYDPYGKAYRAYTYPSSGFEPGTAGPVRNRAPAPNQFDRLGDDLGLGGEQYGRYDRAYRRFDREFGRQYTPNEKADASFNAERERGEADLIRSMRERSPARYDLPDRTPRGGSPDEPARDASTNRRASPAPRAPGLRDSRPSDAPPAPRLPDRLRPTGGNQARSSSIAPRPPAPTGAARPTSAPRPGSGSTVPSPSDVLDRSQKMERGRAPLTSPRRAS